MDAHSSLRPSGSILMSSCSTSPCRGSTASKRRANCGAHTSLRAWSSSRSTKTPTSPGPHSMRAGSAMSLRRGSLPTCCLPSGQRSPITASSRQQFPWKKTHKPKWLTVTFRKTKQPNGMKTKIPKLRLLTPALGLALLGVLASAQAADKKPNILVIMGDDIGWFNVGSYNQGIMLQTTPNLDKLATEGMRFTDYYAEASCTAGRANFITGELPIRTGLTTVGQAGSALGMP